MFGLRSTTVKFHCLPGETNGQRKNMFSHRLWWWVIQWPTNALTFPILALLYMSLVCCHLNTVEADCGSIIFQPKRLHERIQVCCWTVQDTKRWFGLALQLLQVLFILFVALYLFNLINWLLLILTMLHCSSIFLLWKTIIGLCAVSTLYTNSITYLTQCCKPMVLASYKLLLTIWLVQL